MNKGVWSEELAKTFLQQLGYNIERIRHKVIIGNNEVAEIDLIVTDPSGIKYAVEVKSGKISISDVRQAYVNAKLVNLKPMIIGKSFANEAVLELAKKLDVKVLLLPEFIIIDLDALKKLIHNLIYETLINLLKIPKEITDKDRAIIEVIAKASDIQEVKQLLNIKDNKQLNKMFSELKSKGILTDTINFNSIKVRAIILYLILSFLKSIRL